MNPENQEQKVANFFTPNDEYYRSLRGLLDSDFEGIHLKSPEEIEDFLNREIATDSDQTKEAENRELSTEAEALESFFKEKDASIKMAQQILDAQSDCIEAQLCLIGWEPEAETRIELLEDLLENCEASLDITDDFLKTDRGRAFVRIKALLGETYLTEDYYDDGMELIQEVFEEDSLNDFNVGVIIAIELAKKAKWPALVRFWNKFDAQENIITSVLRAISYFNIYGNKAKSKQALNQAYQLDPIPFKVIVGTMNVEGISDEEYGNEESFFTVQMLYDLMSKNEKLTRWMVTNVMRNEGG